VTVQIVGRSRGLIHAIELAERFAPTSMSILLVGATGTAKSCLPSGFTRQVVAEDRSCR
jgi:transcriptional regulator with PAS, ATPase and Fis domain